MNHSEIRIICYSHDILDFSEPLNVVPDSQYAERVVLIIETAKLIPDDSELTFLFIKL